MTGTLAVMLEPWVTIRAEVNDEIARANSWEEFGALTSLELLCWSQVSIFVFSLRERKSFQFV